MNHRDSEMRFVISLGLSVFLFAAVYVVTKVRQQNKPQVTQPAPVAAATNDPSDDLKFHGTPAE